VPIRYDTIGLGSRIKVEIKARIEAMTSFTVVVLIFVSSAWSICLSPAHDEYCSRRMLFRSCEGYVQALVLGFGVRVSVRVRIRVWVMGMYRATVLQYIAIYQKDKNYSMGSHTLDTALGLWSHLWLDEKWPWKAQFSAEDIWSFIFIVIVISRMKMK